MSDELKPGDRCRLTRRRSIEAMAFNCDVVTVTRQHPMLKSVVQVEGDDGYRSWIAVAALYKLRTQIRRDPRG